jgi:tetratricopeptide (TPR) repeat protein
LCLAESDDAAKQQTALEIANGNFRANPNSPQMASTLAWILYRMGNVQQAKQLFSQVTSLANFPSDTAFYVSRLLIEEGDDENAANLLRESLKAPGLFLYRKRAEEELAAIEKRLAEKKDSPAKPVEPGGDKR